MEAPVVAAIVAGGVSLLGAGVTAWLTLLAARNRAGVDDKLARLKGELDGQLAAARAQVERELADQKARLDNKTVFAAEGVAHALLTNEQWRWRTFRVIRHHLGGFEDDELRKILVRAGAIRSVADGQEVWGLLERNPGDIGVEQLSITIGSRKGGGGQTVVQDFG